MRHTAIDNLLRLILLLAAFGIPAGDARAQDNSGPVLPVFPIEPAEEPTFDAPADDLRTAPVDLPAGYWIVSSRRCPQSGAPNCVPGRFDYFHADSDGQLRRSCLEEYQRSLIPDAPVCIVVHGSYSTWRSLVDEAGPVTRWMRKTDPDQPLHVVFFTWPSEPITALLPGVDVAIFGRRASFNGFYLSQLVQEMPDGARISFFAHSHGSRVTAAALHLLDGGELWGYRLRAPGRGNRTLRPVFAAAAIDHHWLNPGERFGRALNQVDHGLVLFNEKDVALTLYPLRRLFSHRPLGLVGFDPLDRRLQNGRACKLAEVDVTAQVDTGHFWSHYFDQPAIATAMKPYLFFNDEQPMDRCLGAAGIHTGRPQRIPVDHVWNMRNGVIRDSSSVRSGSFRR